MENPIRRFISVEPMVRREDIRGDLPTTREAYKNLLEIALPSVMEMVLISLIGSADTIMVGTVGTAAIAAVGLVGQPRMLMMSVFFALNVGVTAIVARRKGQGLRAEANRTLRNALVIILALCGVMMALALGFSEQLMRLAGAKDDTIGMANTYFRVLAMALPINALTMCINAAQRGTGNTRITMYANFVANLVNVLFNYLLIGGHWGFPRLEVAGAAYATVIGFFVGFLLSAFALVRGSRGDRFLGVSRHDDWRLHKETVAGIVRVGGNAMVEQVAMRIGFFAYAAIVASLGTNAFAAHQICAQFQSISFTFGDGLGVAATALVGQMLGRKRPDLSVIYGKCSQRLALLTALALALLIVIFRYPLVDLFVDTATEDGLFVYHLAARVMLMVALFQPFQTSSVVISGCLRGAGDTKYVARVMLLCVTLIRPLVSLFALHVLGLDLVGAWSASILDMAIRVTLVYRRFNGGKWHDIRV